MTRKIKEVFKCPKCNNNKFDTKQSLCPINENVVTYEECMKCGYKKIASVDVQTFPNVNMVKAITYFGAFKKYGERFEE